MPDPESERIDQREIGDDARADQFDIDAQSETEQFEVEDAGLESTAPTFSESNAPIESVDESTRVADPVIMEDTDDFIERHSDEEMTVASNEPAEGDWDDAGSAESILNDLPVEAAEQSFSDDEDFVSPDQGPANVSSRIREIRDNQNRYGAASVSWAHVSPEYLNKVRELYVRPPLAEFDPTFSQSNIVFVKGQPDSGRLFSAIGFMRDSFEARSTGESRPLTEHCYLLDADRDRVGGLLELVREAKNIPPESYLILPDFHELGFDQRDLSDERLTKLRSFLSMHDLTLIVTIDSNADYLSRIGANCDVLSLEFSDEEQRQLFIGSIVEIYLDRFHQFAGKRLTSEDKQVVENKYDEICRNFKSPAQVNELFNGLGVSVPGSDRESVDRKIARIASVESALQQDWFNPLSLNEKIYALLVAVMRDLSPGSVHQLYRKLITQLREQNFPVEDYRQTGIVDLLRQIYVEREAGGERYRFLNERYAKEVQGQISNYRDLMWTALILASETFDKSEELLRKLGRAVGRLGGGSWSELTGMLDSWASLPQGKQAVMPAAALGSLLESNEKQVFDLLGRWAGSQSSQQSWTAAIAVAECYEVLGNRKQESLQTDSNAAKQKLEELLEAIILVDFPERFVNNKVAIDYAIGRMFLVDPRRIVDLLGRWMAGQVGSFEMDQSGADSGGENSDAILEPLLQQEEEEPEEDGVGRSSFPRIGAFYSLTSLSELQDIDAVSSEERDWVLKLAENVLSFEYSEPSEDSHMLNLEQDDTDVPSISFYWLSFGMEVVREWVDTSLRNKVHRLLMNILTRVSISHRRRFRQILQQDWIHSSTQAVTEIAQSLSSYSLVLDGNPVDPSTSGAGLMIVGFPDEADGNARREAFEIHKQLSHRARVQVVAQGNLHEQITDQQAVTFATFTRLDSGVPLIGPLLENSDPRSFHFVLLLQWQNRRARIEGITIDFEDLAPPSEFESNTDDTEQASGCLAERLIAIAHRDKWDTGKAKAEVGRYEYLNLGSKTTRNKISRLVSDRIDISLAQRTGVQCWAALQEAEPDLQDADFDLAIELLERCLEEISTSDGGDLHQKPSKTISGIFNWMLKTDMNRTFHWIANGLGHETHELRFVFANSFFMMYYRLARCCQFYAADEICAPLRLGKAFSMRSGDCMHQALSLLELIIMWSGQEDTRAVLESSEGARETGEFIRRIPLTWKKEFVGRLDREIKQVSVLSEELSKSGVAEPDLRNQVIQLHMLRGMRSDLLLGEVQPCPKPDSGQVSLLIVDSSRTVRKKERRNRRASIATKLFKSMREGLTSEDVLPVIFRIGICDPVRVNAGLSNEQLYPSKLEETHGLILPIIERFRAEDIHSIVLLTDRMPVDWEDAVRYYPGGGFVYCESPELDWPLGRWRQIASMPTSDVAEVARTIWKQLENFLW